MKEAMRVFLVRDVVVGWFARGLEEFTPAPGSSGGVLFQAGTTGRVCRVEDDGRVAVLFVNGSRALVEASSVKATGRGRPRLCGALGAGASKGCGPCQREPHVDQRHRDARGRSFVTIAPGTAETPREGARS